LKPFVLYEIHEVLGVVSRQGQLVRQATGGDPRVVDRPWPATLLSSPLQLSPYDCDPLVEREQNGTSSPGVKAGATPGPPASDYSPLRQLTQRYEGNASCIADQHGPKRVIEAIIEAM
jgi:hypothetical protein